MTVADVKAVELLAASRATEAEVLAAIAGLGLDVADRETLAGVCKALGIKPGRTAASAAEVIRRRVHERRMTAMVNYV